MAKSSESTMHTLYKDDFCVDLSAFEQQEDGLDAISPVAAKIERSALKAASDALGVLQDSYAKAEAKDEKNAIRHAMKKVLPSGFLQKRGTCLNYEVLANMYAHRKDHRLPEWSEDFVKFVRTLPYCEFITGEFGQ